MCTVNSHKITVASKCSQQTTVNVSYHLDMYNIPLKNDKLARFIFVKIVKPIEIVKQQILYFSQLHPSAIILYKNLHGNMLHIFIPISFLKKHHLLIDKQKDPTSIKFTASLLFFLARACQHKTSKIGITILSLPQLKLCILKIANNLKALLQIHLILPEKYQKQCISYFYQIPHFMMNPTKFGSPHLDINNSTYEFLKHTFKSVKTNKKSKTQ